MNRINWIILCSLPVAFVGTMSWFGLFTFLNSYIVAELGHTNEDWTSTTLWLTGSMLVWLVLITDICAKIGRRTTMIAGMLAITVAFAGIGMTRSLGVISAMLVLVAFGQTVMSTIWLGLLTRSSPRRPGRAIATYMFIFTFLSAGLLMAGGSLAAAMSYQGLFLATAGVSLAGSVVFIFASKHLDTGRDSPLVSIRKVGWSNLRQLLTPAFAALLVGGMILGPATYLTMNQLYPNLARDVHHLGEAKIAWIVGLARVPALLPLLIMGHFVDRISAMRCFGASTAVSGLVIIALGNTTVGTTGAGVYLCFYLIHGCTWGCNNATIHATTPRHMTELGFALAMMVNLVGVFAVGLLHRTLLGAGVGIGQVFVICGGLGVLGGLVMLILTFSRYRQRPGTHEPLHAAAVAIDVCRETSG